MKDWKLLIVSLVLPFAAAAIGSLSTSGAIDTWYRTLERPMLAPPNWVFGPVWTLLYLMMGIAFYLVWRRGTGAPFVKPGILIFLVQLALNTVWSLLFFGAENITAALIDIVFLWLAIVATIYLFFKVSRTAAYLLVPYLLWVSFATYLNYGFWVLN